MTAESLPREESSPDALSVTRHPEIGFLLAADLVINRPVGDVFEFFADAKNLQMITPPWLHFKIVTPASIEMGQGTLIDYRIRLHGLPIRWRTEIAAWEPPYRFVDQQLRGPYKKWYHEHTFESLGADQTLAKDRVHYIPRFGALVHRWLVQPDLTKIFTYRQLRLLQHFETGDVAKM